MVVSDKKLINLLAVIGVYIDHLNHRVKIFSVLIIVFYCASTIYFLIATCKFISSYSVESISYFSLKIVSILAWLLLLKRRNEIVIKELYHYRKRYNVRRNPSLLKRKMIFILTLVVFALSQLEYHFDWLNNTLGINTIESNHHLILPLYLVLYVAVALRHSCLTVFAWRRVVLRFSTRNNCCEFLAFHGVNTQSIIQSLLRFDLCVSFCVVWYKSDTFNVHKNLCMISYEVLYLVLDHSDSVNKFGSYQNIENQIALIFF